MTNSLIGGVSGLLNSFRKAARPQADNTTASTVSSATAANAGPSSNKRKHKRKHHWRSAPQPEGTVICGLTTNQSTLTTFSSWYQAKHDTQVGRTCGYGSHFNFLTLVEIVKRSTVNSRYYSSMCNNVLGICCHACEI